MLPVQYPVPLDDIVVVGYRGKTTRSLTVRPKQQGRYVLVAWPQGFVEEGTIIRHELFFPQQNSRPAQIVIDTRRYREYGLTKWQWKLFQYNEFDEPPDNSTVIFSDHHMPSGSLTFDPLLGKSEVRTIMWSCHQPFENQNGVAALHSHVAEIMEWYYNIVQSFKPDVIWGGGDSAYSDGAGPTTFTEIRSQPGWFKNPDTLQKIREAYRNMYRYHWSIGTMPKIMGSYPHIFMWDDHEIFDGWGSNNNDDCEEHQVMYDIAHDVAQEYILNAGPRVQAEGDAHQSYIMGHVAHFITDTRTSRDYLRSAGRLMSEQQINDLESFCRRVALDLNVRHLLLCTTVPFVHVIDLVLIIAITYAKLDDKDSVDDIRDGWMMNRNRATLDRVLKILGRLQAVRPDIQIVNISGDIHIANAFEIETSYSDRPIYQITSSAITNRDHLDEGKRAAAEFAADLTAVIKGLNVLPEGVLLDEWKRTADELAAVIKVPTVLPDGVRSFKRIWKDITDPNVLAIRSTPTKLEFELHVLPVDGSTNENLTVSLVN